VFKHVPGCSFVDRGLGCLCGLWFLNRVCCVVVLLVVWYGCFFSPGIDRRNVPRFY